MLRPFLAASTLSISLTAASVAPAAEGPWVPKAQGSRIGVDFDWWPTDTSVASGAPGAPGPITYSSHSLTFDLVGQIQLARVAYLDFDVPWAIWDRGTSSHRDATFVFGNPAVGAHWADTLNDRIAVFAGGTLSVSTLVSDGSFIFVADHIDLYSTRAVASETRAYADLHRFAPDRFFIRPHAGIELRILPVLYYRVDLAPILAIPVSNAADHSVVLFDIHNEIEARAPIGVGGGMDLQAVFVSDDPANNSDAVQTAMEPYFVYEPTRGFYARAGVLVALDEQLGFGFDNGKVATIRIALGGKW